MNYQKHYHNLINRAKSRALDSYTETHHIIPRCMGGSNIDENLVKLTPEEHYIAHQLLVKLYPEENKLVYALRMMCMSCNGKSKRTNKEYGWIRRLWRKISSENQKGIPKGPRSIETKEKISNTLKEQYKSGERISYMSGKTITDEHKEKISKHNKGKIISKDHKEKISKAKTGIKFSEDHKKKLSDSSARKGKEPWNKGLPLTNDTKEKIGAAVSKALKGRSWEDIYGIDGAAKRREDVRIRKLNKQKVDLYSFEATRAAIAEERAKTKPN